MSPRLAELAEAWSAAVNGDGDLVTELELAGAIDEAHAVTVGRYAYWVEYSGRNRWPRRKPAP